MTDATPPPVPFGSMIVLTDDRQLEIRLRTHLAADGWLADRQARLVMLDLPEVGAETVYVRLGEVFSDDELDKIFLLIESDDVPHLIGLRGLVGRCRHSWFYDLLSYGDFRSHLQPIVDLRAARIFGYEALLRPRGSDGASIAPDRALVAARATSRLAEFEWMARASAIRAGQALASDERLFINIDAGGFGAEAFAETVALAQSLPMPADHIVFELVESEGLSSSPEVDALVSWIRGAGFKVALDDVGSGFASLGVLDRVRPDVVKLDQRLVRGAHADAYRARLVQAFAELTRDLGALLVVEGVETAEDLALVHALEVPLVQGFLFARPAAEPIRSLAHPIPLPLAAGARTASAAAC